MKVNFDRLLSNHRHYLSLMESLPYLAEVFDDETKQSEFVESVLSEIRMRLVDDMEKSKNE